MLSVIPPPRFKAFDGSGKPLAGGRLYSYSPGTSNPKATYADPQGSTPNPNPVVLDSNGEAAVWLSGFYKVVLTDANGVQLWSVDQVSSAPAAATPNGEWVQVSATFTYVSATRFTAPGDMTTVFQAGRRVQAVVSAGTIYGMISASVYSAGITTVTVSWDSGSLDSGLSAVSVGLLAILNPSTNISVEHNSDGTHKNWASVKSFGAKGDGVTDDTTAIQNAINSAKNVYLPAATYVFTNITIPAEATFYGDGMNKTILKSATTGNAITISGHRVNIKDMTVQKSGAVAGNGIVCDNAYWFKTQNVLVTGFAYNLYGAKTLYHEHDNSRFENGTYGVYYYGIAGVWNVDWFNNVLTFTNCRFLNNTNTNAYIKGSQIVMVNPDYSTGGSIGLNILGDSVSYPSLGFTIIDPYVELTPIAFSFSYARGRIVGGFAQGNTAISPYTSVLDLANSSTVDVLGLQTISYWTWKYRATVNSTLNVYGALWQGAGGTESVDATSISFQGTFTATLTGCTTSPTATVTYVRSGNTVTLYIPAITGTSNSTSATLTGVPASLTPAVNTPTMAMRVTDNGATTMGLVQMNVNGTMTLYKDATGTPNAFTATGTKGMATMSVTYTIN